MWVHRRASFHSTCACGNNPSRVSAPSVSDLQLRNLPNTQQRRFSLGKCRLPLAPRWQSAIVRPLGDLSCAQRDPELAGPNTWAFPGQFYKPNRFWVDTVGYGVKSGLWDGKSVQFGATVMCKLGMHIYKLGTIVITNSLITKFIIHMGT